MKKKVPLVATRRRDPSECHSNSSTLSPPDQLFTVTYSRLRLNANLRLEELTLTPKLQEVLFFFNKKSAKLNQCYSSEPVYSPRLDKSPYFRILWTIFNDATNWRHRRRIFLLRKCTETTDLASSRLKVTKIFVSLKNILSQSAYND